MASRAEVEAVTVCPAASRMAHLRVTTWGSSSTQRILAIKGDVLNADALFEFMARLRKILAAAQEQLTKLPYSQPRMMLKSNKSRFSLRFAVLFSSALELRRLSTHLHPERSPTLTCLPRCR